MDPNPSLEVSLSDESGSLTVVFTGRWSIGGVQLGTIMTVTGVVANHRGAPMILNPSYSLIPRRPSRKTQGNIILDGRDRPQACIVRSCRAAETFHAHV